MNNWHFVLVLFCTSSLFACSSQPENQSSNQPKFNEFFATDIKENDLKIFTYKISIETPSTGSRGGMRGGGSMGRGGRGGGEMSRGTGQKPNFENIKKELEEKTFSQLEAKLVETGYCREGYTTINSYFERAQSEIHGECNEGATEGDREKFTSVKNIVTSKTPKDFSDIIVVPDNP
jgi:hypothetical protein